MGVMLEKKLDRIIRSILSILLYFFSIYIICRISLFDGFRKHYVLEENVKKLEKYITITLIIFFFIFACYYCFEFSNSMKEYEMRTNSLSKLYSSHSNSIADSLIQQKELENAFQQQTVALYVYFGIQLVGRMITYICMIFFMKKYIAIYNVPYRKTKKAT